MKNTTPTPQATKKQLQKSLEQGIALAMDPENRLTLPTGEAITTLYSPWFYQYCISCQHTFRVGDEVQIATNGEIRHHSAALPCAGGVVSQAPNQSEMQAFFAGLDRTWPPPKNLRLQRLTPGDSLLAPPHAGFRRHCCAVCGHTLRPQDQVVLCPCQPKQPLCQIAIHRDLVHGLHCWDNWNQVQDGRYCLATSRKLDR